MKNFYLFCSFLLISFYASAQVPFVYDKENTGAHYPAPPLPTLNQLPVEQKLTDPFMWSNGSGRSTNFSDWERRRNEIKREIEHYEIGIKPAKPDTITATYTPEPNGGRLTVVVVRNAKALTLTSHINLPATGSGPFPAVIGIALAPGAGASTGSLPSNIFTSRNVATIEYVHNQVTTYAAGQDAPKVNDPFFILYPELINNGQYSAWIWGVSRLIDGLEIVAKSGINPLPIDLKHLAITGCSYAGKMALFSGAFDERIALTIAQESGGGGAPAWRVSHAIEPNGTVEKIDNTDDSWFMKSMRQFSGDNVYKLPHDHHELMAMIAPRALLVTGNTDFTWLSNRSAYVSSMATKEIYKTFGIGDRFGFYIDGGHGHCAIPSSQVPAISAFVDKFLLGKTSVNTNIGTHPFGTLEHERWYKWWGKPTVKPSQSFIINDRAENNTVVGKVTATDPDANTTFQNWQITGGTGADMFSINSATGEITVVNRALLDFDNIKSYTLEVTVSDGVATSDAGLVTINLTHAPVITAGQMFNINEWVKDNYMVGTAKVADKDENTTFSNWKIVGGTGADLFAINTETGEIKTTNSSTLNFSNTYSYTLQVSVSDGLNESLPATLTINLSEKVNVCHFGNTQLVRRSKVPDHIKHGDATSACESINNNQSARVIASDAEMPANGDNKILVYPNPARGKFLVDLGNNASNIKSLQVLDAVGKTVMQIPVNQKSVITIPKGSLNPGMYIIRLQGDKVINRKIIME